MTITLCELVDGAIEAQHHQRWFVAELLWTAAASEARQHWPTSEDTYLHSAFSAGQRRATS